MVTGSNIQYVFRYTNRKNSLSILLEKAERSLTFDIESAFLGKIEMVDRGRAKIVELMFLSNMGNIMKEASLEYGR